MAIPWLKIEATLPKKPEVLRIAKMLKLDRFSVVGRLVEVWAWADQHSVDGNAMDVTEDFLNELAGHKQFCRALREVGWLSGTDDALTFPNFDRHNGTTAKTRATGAKRQDTFRGHHKSNADTVTEVTPAPLRNPHKSVTRSDQIRSEDYTLSSAPAREGEESAEGGTGSGRPQSWPADEAAARRIATEHDIDPNLAATLWHSHETRQHWPPGPFLSALKAKAGYVQQDLLGKQVIASTRPSAPQPHPTRQPPHEQRSKHAAIGPNGY